MPGAPLLLLLVAVAAASDARKEERVDRATEAGSREVTETQHAICKVTTEELVATAQATVTRVLTGLCNAKEMADRFQALETQLGEQLNVIKALIVNVETQDLAAKRAHRRILSTLLRTCGPATQTKSPTTEDDPEEEDVDDAEDPDGPRAPEIARYNSSIHTEPDGRRVFTYYWRVRHVHAKLTGWSARRSLRSPSFYVAPRGYRMYLRLHPRQGGTGVYVHAGLTRGDFDGALVWPFRLRLRAHVLDQAAGAPQDVVSRVWDPAELCSDANWQRPLSGDNYECVGLGFPHDVLRSRSYVWDDSIVIKLTVYMQ